MNNFCILLSWIKEVNIKGAFINKRMIYKEKIDKKKNISNFEFETFEIQNSMNSKINYLQNRNGERKIFENIFNGMMQRVHKLIKQIEIRNNQIKQIQLNKQINKYRYIINNIEYILVYKQLIRVKVIIINKEYRKWIFKMRNQLKTMQHTMYHYYLQNNNQIINIMLLKFNKLNNNNKLINNHILLILINHQIFKQINNNNRIIIIIKNNRNSNSKSLYSICMIQIIKLQTPQVVQNASGSRTPVLLQCCFCNQHSVTTITYKPGNNTYWVSLLLCLFFGCLCFIPLLSGDCKDVYHQCSYCGKVVGHTPYKPCS
ncbi:unnamed protein product (macronuclear) [Paramecium tetraurelia]|uniref:LITAF domain-containing protein n=1 Tax=Paramecium tetraurelia TaxID=5888 RepID=A0DCD3_PARTE|nr:uncharacterized protein GSPATT00015578001 [Paramecium tetraurelia]CAK80700.1 unnamed protein product [Paramecium tetraurelia]|eukprot:XP_001448097.1 hypothetical protein (macronuclear) [Paramecium tetraurelia strain d4-2]